MQGGTIKSIVIFVLLAIFAFIAGSFVTDGLTEALIPTVMVVGAFGLMALGKNSWWLLFLAPPVLQLIPIAALQNFPVAYFCCGLVLAYWVLMSLTGQVRLTWNGVKWLDIATLVLCTYFLSTWVRHPVTINAFVSYTDEGDQAVGGKDYLMCVGAIVFYITISVIPMKLESVVKVLKWAFWAVLFVSVLLGIKQVFKPDDVSGAVEALEAEGESSRNSSYTHLGMMIFQYVFAKYSVLGVVMSPFKCSLVLFSCGMMLISGFRTLVLQSFFFVLFISYFQRRLLIFLLLIIMFWGTLVFLSQLGFFSSLPYAVQRSLSTVPVVQMSDDAEFGAEASLEWRYEMWEWGLNPRMGLIKDYVWGDGFGQIVSDIKVEKYMISTGRAKSSNMSHAERGGWHSGWLTAIHRTGYVGLVILTVWFLLFVFSAFLVCKFVRSLEGKEYLYMNIIMFPVKVISFYWSAGTWFFVYVNCFYQAAIIKLVYALARDEGMMKPMFQRKRYVPLMVEANESQPKLRVL